MGRRWFARMVVRLAAGCFCAAGAGGAPETVIVPRPNHPGAGQVFYFVLTDRFANGSTANDTGGILGGSEVSGFDPAKISHYHGGDFVGLTSKLDYIKGLGVTAIWITPPFKNKAMQAGTAGYHGYWILDFTSIDPHLGTEGEFRNFVTQVHKRGLKVFLDIVVNHTADVIEYKDGSTQYVDLVTAPYSDASGRTFDPHSVAYNGVGSDKAFPRLSAETSFPHIPVVAAADAHAKGPDWLNDVTLYHNRGNSTFRGESALFGDFAGLDDVFTENPQVVRGFISVYGQWIERYGIDGFRIDTVKHVNLEFWEAFEPAIREKARSLRRPDFFQFGEVMDETGDTPFMSEFSTTGNLDGVIDFGFLGAARNFVSQEGDTSVIDSIFLRDAWYTNHDNTAQNAVTFLSNHDAGRFAYFLKKDNPDAGPGRLSNLVLLGYELLLTARGQPVIYYGDEQGMIGIGNDMGAREDMFPSRAPEFRDQPLLGTTRSGGDDKFDIDHPFYRAIRTLALQRETHPGLLRGAMLLRDSGQPHVFAFSRIDRRERVEYLVAMNNSRRKSLSATLATCQAPGATFQCLYDSEYPDLNEGPALTAGKAGEVIVSLAPLQCIVWKADAPLAAPSTRPSIAFATPASGSTFIFETRSRDGHTIPIRQELRAAVTGGDGFAEVTFVMKRASRPDQCEYLGTSDSPPYRIFWRPPADLAAGEEVSFIATVNDLRGHTGSAEIDHLRVAKTPIEFGVKGAVVPFLTQQPPASVAVPPGKDLALSITATGTGPIEIRWLHDGSFVNGATGPVLTVKNPPPAAAGHYRAMIRNREGTCLSRDVTVTVGPAPAKS